LPVGKHVVHARLGGGNHQLRIGGETLARGEVELAAGGHVAIAYEQFVRNVAAGAVEPQPDGLTRGDFELVIHRLAGAQRIA